jgi:glycosyltransferase involved in cell wall biosynthesis
MSLTKLDWVGPVLTNFDEYTELGRTYLNAILRRGVDVKLVANEPNVDDSLKATGSIWHNLCDASSKKEDSDIRINMGIPPVYLIGKKRNIGITLWETTKYHGAWGNIINAMDGMIVPSSALKHALEDSGFRENLPIEVVSPAIDNDIFTPHGRKVRIQEYKEDDVVFIFNGNWIPRKNYDLLILAFAVAFKDLPREKGLSSSLHV